MSNRALTCAWIGILALSGCVFPGEGDPASESAEALRLSGRGQANVSGTFSFNGGAFPASVYENAEILMVPVGGGEPILLGQTRDQTYSAKVPNGSYDVLYNHLLGDQVPQNEMATVMRGVFIDGPTRLNIAVQGLTASGQFFVNGAPCPNSVYDNGQISFRRGGEPGFDVGQTRDQSYEVVVLPGKYEALYDNLVASWQMPANNMAEVGNTQLAVDPTTWHIDIPSVPVEVSATHNGAPFPNSIYENADLHLRDASGEDLIDLGNTYDGFDPLRLVPGSYDVIYDRNLGDQIPKNENTVVMEAVAIDFADPMDTEAPFLLGVDVPSIELDGSYELNGGSFPASVYENAKLFLIDDQSALIELGQTRFGGYAGVVVIPGTYDVLYEKLLGGETVPANEQHLVAANVLLDVTQTYDIALTVHETDGNLSSFGGPPSGAFWAQRTLGGIACKYCPAFPIAPAGSSSYVAQLIPGTYRVFYSGETDAEDVVAQGNIIEDAWLVDSDETRHFSAGGLPAYVVF